MKRKSFGILACCLILASFFSFSSQARIKEQGGKAYLYSKSGKLLKNGFQKVGGKVYYVNAKGVIQKGWKTIGGNRYFFKKNGVLQTGWKNVGSKTYYLSKSKKIPGRGKALTGWQRIQKKWHYFDERGVMAKKTWVGTSYVNKKGEYVKKKTSPLVRLKKQVEDYIRSNCVPGSWAVYVKDLDSGASFSINNKQMYSACLIKVFGMGAAFEMIEDGTFTYDSVKGLLQPMITVSSNDCFNSLVRLMGKSRINEFCKKHGYIKTNQGKGIAPASNSGGLENGTGGNLTSVEDCGAILEEIYRGRLVSKSASEKMLSILKQQQLRGKIPAGIPSGVAVGNKTGETGLLTHDMAIVFGPKKDYIICVMTDTSNPGAAVGGIQGISRLTYRFLN